MRNFLNFLIFYAAWYICVSQNNLVAGLIGLLLAALNIVIIRIKPKEIFIILALGMCGFLTDALAFHLKVFEFVDGRRFFISQNLWLYSLWVIFLTTFSGSLSFLKGYKWHTLLFLGMTGGIISYFTAYKLRVITFPNEAISLTYIAVNWAIIFLLFFRVYYFLRR